VKKRWNIETGSMLSFVQVTAEKIIVKAKEEALMITAKANEEAQKSIADAAMKTERVSESSV
jgi:F0F1-type ATP synthase membrane subunit b/b'